MAKPPAEMRGGHPSPTGGCRAFHLRYYINAARPAAPTAQGRPAALWIGLFRVKWLIQGSTAPDIHCSHATAPCWALLRWLHMPLPAAYHFTPFGLTVTPLNPPQQAAPGQPNAGYPDACRWGRHRCLELQPSSGQGHPRFPVGHPASSSASQICHVDRWLSGNSNAVKICRVGS